MCLFFPWTQWTAMFNNVTESPVNGSHKACSWYGITKNHSTIYYAIALSASIIIAVLSPVAVIGNALITAAIWKNRSLRTPSYIFLCSLAFTDLCTGLVSQPFHTAIILLCLKRPQRTSNQQSFPAYVKDIAECCGAKYTLPPWRYCLSHWCPLKDGCTLLVHLC